MACDVSIRIYDVARHFPILLHCKRIQVLWGVMSLEVLQNPGADAQDSAREPRHSPTINHKLSFGQFKGHRIYCLPLLQHSIAALPPSMKCCERQCFSRHSPPTKCFCGCSSSVSRSIGEQLQEILRRSISHGSFNSKSTKAYVECHVESLRSKCG